MPNNLNYLRFSLFLLFLHTHLKGFCILKLFTFIRFVQNATLWQVTLKMFPVVLLWLAPWGRWMGLTNDPRVNNSQPRILARHLLQRK